MAGAARPATIVRNSRRSSVIRAQQSNLPSGSQGEAARTAGGARAYRSGPTTEVPIMTRGRVVEQPPNPATLTSAPAGQFLCYRAKCPRRPAAPRFIRDRFGDHAVAAKATQLVCAPSVDAPPGSCVDISDFDQPCGADDGGRCFLGVFPFGNLVCVDAPSCSGVCTSDDECSNGQVCAGRSSSRSAPRCTRNTRLHTALTLRYSRASIRGGRCDDVQLLALPSQAARPGLRPRLRGRTAASCTSGEPCRRGGDRLAGQPD